MRVQTLTTTVRYCALGELRAEDRDLVLAARNATQNSHSPYSGFRVGAALRLADGSVVAGANQENASYGLCLCAERSAIFTAHNAGRKRDIRAIAITGRIGSVPEAEYKGTVPLSPCGACRQVIRETEDLAGTPLIILMDCYGDEVAVIDGIGGLLPLGFGPNDFGASMDG